MSELDVIGAITGTDKSSSVDWSWDYLRHYEVLFSPWRHEAINMIEIGVASGSSLAAWLRFFDKATLVGIDVNPACKRFAGERVAIRIGSQEDPGFLHGVAAEFPPSIIIDDGSHVAHDMIASFEALFPALAPGGVYVFEDMTFHFEESPLRYQAAKAHQGLSDVHIFDYLSKFIRARLGGVTIPQGVSGFTRYAFANIDSITVAGGILAITKKAPRDIGQAVAVFERELTAGAFNRNTTAYRYAEYLIKHETNLERAAALLGEVLAAEPRNETALASLARMSLRQGRLDDAAQAATALTQINPNHVPYWDQLADMENRRRRPEGQAAALRRLIELQPRAGGYYYRLALLVRDTGDRDSAHGLAQQAVALEPRNGDFAALLGSLGG
jgi:hypothetical protein